MRDSFPRVRPYEVGIDAKALCRALEKIDVPENGTHAFMVLRHGKVAAEAYWAPYAAEKKHCLFSVSKSFTCMAVGFAVQEGLLSVDDKVISFFPEHFVAPPCENMQKITVKHCLTMTPGFSGDPHNFPYLRRDDVINDFPYSYHGFTYREERLDWIDNFLHTYVPYEPGSEFIYCTQGTYLLAAIVQKVTGQTVFDYLKPRLFEPLGIENATWQTGPQGVTVAGWGLDICLEDLAKFAQFLLQKGKWKGQQLLDAAWIEDATSCQIHINNPDASWNEEFGYQIWLCEHPGAYRGDGAFGQKYVVIPDKDAVVVFFSGSRNTDAVMDAIWEEIVPAMGEEAAADPEAEVALEKKIAGLRIQPPAGAESSPAAAKVSGRRYELSPNYTGFTSLRMDFENSRVTLGFGEEEFTLGIGYDGWVQGKTCVKTEDTDTDVTIVYESVSCAGAWVGEDTYRLVLCFDETSYINTMDITFREHGVEIHHTRNVSFMQSTTLRILGFEF